MAIPRLWQRLTRFPLVSQTTALLLFSLLGVSSGAFHVPLRPAIVRIVALPMSDVEVDLKATNARPYDYYEQDLSDEDNRKSISAAPSFEEYMNQRATDE